MCLSIPSKVVEIDLERNVATVDTMGVKREAGLELMQDGDVQIGDYVLLHIGFIMNKIDESDALESLKVYSEILEKLDEEERRHLVEEDDNCPNRDA
ncbi:HypC/HybG/HupF family hydrogenase formation chaperone [Sulfurimonas paralvinellae]|uniref:HypC/HybG/HupF family hydrogenase formation chaperone n=1 Tax=Sulfurimonas paralvinellae TaxID=317658 RepID=A0A7M1BD84_9BACT|nr:HypC/HybG/HupF family hydrogenase formation chaperone [Sulfurimonas paralvinellae]QOP46788.1 HypC/HybG/HupF family hydrogenase formation chaperone [Sulfurimonas paralvinellae]